MKIVCSVLTACIVLGTAHADSWSYRDGVRTWRFAQGLRVDVVTDARRDGSARVYTKILKGSRVLAILNGVGFETLVESPNHQVYVGLSNFGLPGTAAVVFDRDGRLILYASHQASNLAYCRESVTIERTWFDAENPDVQFGTDGLVTLNDCSGKRVDLLRTVGQALAPGTD